MNVWDVLKCYKKHKMTVCVRMFSSGSPVPQTLCWVYSGVLREETVTYSSMEQLFTATKRGKCWWETWFSTQSDSGLQGYRDLRNF